MKISYLFRYQIPYWIGEITLDFRAIIWGAMHDPNFSDELIYAPKIWIEFKSNYFSLLVEWWHCPVKWGSP